MNLNEPLKLSHAGLAELLSKTIPAGLPVLIQGPPGIGKTDAVNQAAQSLGAELIVTHPATSDPTDIKGLPWISQGADRATFLPFGDLHRAINAPHDKPTVWFFDDFGQATPAVQASTMNLIQARTIAGNTVPDTVTFLLGTNRAQDKAGVTAILEPIKSRMASIVELAVELEDWLAWAVKNSIDPMILAFLQFRPEMLMKFEPTRELKNSPSPRTWVKANAGLKLGLSLSTELAFLEGAIGKSAAFEFAAFRDVFMDLPTFVEIFDNPNSATIPEKPAGKYGIITSVAMHTNGKTIKAATTYFDRLGNEWAALGLKFIQKHNPTAFKSADGIAYLSSPAGHAIFGRSA